MSNSNYKFECETLRGGHFGEMKKYNRSSRAYDRLEIRFGKEGIYLQEEWVGEKKSPPRPGDYILTYLSQALAEEVNTMLVQKQKSEDWCNSAWQDIANDLLSGVPLNISKYIYKIPK